MPPLFVAGVSYGAVRSILIAEACGGLVLACVV